METKEENLPFARKLDTTNSSMNPVELNNLVISLRPTVKKCKVAVVRKLVRKMRELCKDKGPGEKVDTKKKKAERFAQEIEALKKLNNDMIIKQSLGNTDTLSDIGKKPSAEARVLLRVACHPPMYENVQKWRKKHADWKSLSAFLIYKNTSRRYKKKKDPSVSKQVKGDAPRKRGQKVKKEGEKTKNNQDKQGKSSLESKSKDEDSGGEGEDASDSDTDDTSSGEDVVVEKPSEVTLRKTPRQDTRVKVGTSSTAVPALAAVPKSAGVPKSAAVPVSAAVPASGTVEGSDRDSDSSTFEDVASQSGTSDSEVVNVEKVKGRVAATTKQRQRLMDDDDDDDDDDDEEEEEEAEEGGEQEEDIEEEQRSSDSTSEDENISPRSLERLKQDTKPSKKVDTEMVVKKLDLGSLVDDAGESEDPDNIVDFLFRSSSGDKSQDQETSEISPPKRKKDSFFLGGYSSSEGEESSDSGNNTDESDSESRGGAKYQKRNYESSFVGSLSKSGGSTKTTGQTKQGVRVERKTFGKNEKITRATSQVSYHNQDKVQGHSRANFRGDTRNNTNYSKPNIPGNKRGGASLPESNVSPKRSVTSDAAEENLHPSWLASKKRREQGSQIQAFSGKKTTFSDDDD